MAFEHEPRVGNLYRSKGGRDTRFWLWVSIKPTSCPTLRSNTACLLGLDEDYNIVSAQSYGIHALRHREVIGHVNIEELRFHDDTRSEQSVSIPGLVACQDARSV